MVLESISSALPKKIVQYANITSLNSSSVGTKNLPTKKSVSVQSVVEIMFVHVSVLLSILVSLPNVPINLLLFLDNIDISSDPNIPGLVQQSVSSGFTIRNLHFVMSSSKNVFFLSLILLLQLKIYMSLCKWIFPLVSLFPLLLCKKMFMLELRERKRSLFHQLTSLLLSKLCYQNLNFQKEKEEGIPLGCILTVTLP